MLIGSDATTVLARDGDTVAADLHRTDHGSFWDPRVSTRAMEDVLWYVLASSRGGPTRARIVRALDDRPRNANELARDLDLDYTTVRHHLEVLGDNNVVKRSADEYGAVYLFTDRADQHWETVVEILETVAPEE